MMMDCLLGKLRSSGIQGLLHLVLLSMSAQLTKKLGMAPGGEFRAAVQEARKLNNNCVVVLGDRPFNVTISRALSSLTVIQKVKLAYQFIASSDDIT
jgi:pheromone shutdown protein TraB